MLSDQEKAEIESYLVHRDKRFALQQERAIKDHLEAVLERRSVQRRAWVSLVAAIGGTTLAGMAFFAWQTILGVTHQEVDAEVKKQIEQFESIREKLGETLDDYEERHSKLISETNLSVQRYFINESTTKILQKQFQSEIDELQTKLKAFSEVPATSQRSAENHANIVRLRLQIDQLDAHVAQLSDDLDRTGVQCTRNCVDHPSCTLKQLIKGECE